MNPIQDTFASVVARPNVVKPQDFTTQFGTWEDVISQVTKYMKPPSPFICKSTNERMDVIEYENGSWLCNIINDIRSYYDLQGFLDSPDMSWFNRIVEEHIELEDPPPLDDGEDAGGFVSDCDDA